MKSVFVEAVQAFPRKKKAEAGSSDQGQKLRFLNETALSRLRDSQWHIKSFRKPQTHASVVSNTFDTQSASLLFGLRRADDEGSGDTIEAHKQPSAEASPAKLDREEPRGQATTNNVKALRRELKKCLPPRDRRGSGWRGADLKGPRIDFAPDVSPTAPSTKFLVRKGFGQQTPALRVAEESQACNIKQLLRKPHGRSRSLAQFRLSPARPGPSDRAKDTPKRRSSLAFVAPQPEPPAFFGDFSRVEPSTASQPKIRLISRQRGRPSHAPEPQTRSVLAALPFGAPLAQPGRDAKPRGLVSEPAQVGQSLQEQPVSGKPKVLYSTSMRKKPDAIMYFPFVVKKKRRPPEPSVHSQTREATSPSARAGQETYCIYINGRFACRATCKPKKPSAG